MPRYLSIAFCEQTHPRCQGYACDDHIDQKCYTTLADDAFMAAVEPLMADIDRLAQQNLDATCRQWCTDNQTDECMCEGDEFIGRRWIDHNTYDGAERNWVVSGAKVLALLRELRSWFGLDDDGADEPVIAQAGK